MKMLLDVEAGSARSYWRRSRAVTVDLPEPESESQGKIGAKQSQHGARTESSDCAKKRRRTSDKSSDLAALNDERDVVERLLARTRREFKCDVADLDLAADAVDLLTGVRLEGGQALFAARVDRRQALNLGFDAALSLDGLAQREKMRQQIDSGEERVEDREEGG
jgi:hypothetical protein